MNPDHRLQVAEKDENSQKRLLALTDAYNLLNPKQTELIGITVYGSVCRGEATAFSDIDAYVFINTDSLPRQPAFELMSKQHDVLFAPDTEARLVMPLKNQIEIRFGDKKNTRLVADIMAVPLSHDLIKENVAMAGQTAQQLHRYRVERAYHDQHGIYTNNSPATNPSPAPDSFSMLSRQLKGLFHPTVCGQLQPYRKTLLIQLVKLGAAGDIIWREDIVSFLETFEGKRLSLPADTTQACRAYGIKIAE